MGHFLKFFILYLGLTSSGYLVVKEMFPKKPVIIHVDPRDELNELILEASSILKDVRKYVSPRHGFEPMIDQAQLIYEDAQGFYSSQRFKEAKNSFQETIEACKEIMALDEMRDLAVNIQESLQSVHEVHEQELYIEAVLAFDNRNFNEAIRLFIALEQKLESKAQVADSHSQQQDLNKFKQYKLKIVPHKKMDETIQMLWFMLALH